MIELVQQHQGVIIDFYGDGMLVFFDPLDGPLSSEIDRAVACALAMQEGIGCVNESLRTENLPALEMGIGIHAGEVIVGNIGSTARAKYGIVGTPVNLTDRIQAEAGPGEVVISQAAYSQAGTKWPVRRSIDSTLGDPERNSTCMLLRRRSRTAKPSLC